MLPNEPKSQLKRYRFNHRRQKHNNQQAAIWGWIAGLIIIIFLILGGIKLVSHHKSSQIALHNHVSRHVSKPTQSANQNNRSNFNWPSTNEVNDPHQRNATVTHGNYVHHPSIPPQPRYHQQRFASVNNAKEWAKATQQRWLHQGYTNYRISSDGQGNYYLQFTK